MLKQEENMFVIEPTEPILVEGETLTKVFIFPVGILYIVLAVFIVTFIYGAIILFSSLKLPHSQPLHGKITSDKSINITGN